jgi:hypothetical protein
VKIYLLTIDAGRPIFYAEGLDAPDADGTPAPQKGLRGWLERTSRRWHEVGRGPQEGVRGRLRRAWNWLHRRLGPDEALLTHLGRAARIDLYYPAPMAPHEAVRLWREYLARRRLHHGSWLVVTLLLSPLTVLLTPIPGPNLIGYWFVYRAVCHLRVVIGVRRALGDQVPTHLRPTTALEPSSELTAVQWMARVARRYRLRGLGAFLKRSAAASPLPEPCEISRETPEE